MNKIKVGTINRPYEVVVGSNLINKKNLEVLEDKEVLLVMDENVPSNFKDLIKDELLNLSCNFQSLEIYASEENKSGKTLDSIHSKLIDERYSRDCIVVGFGGGITCDIAGFAAATYQRGVNFILFPSTLLSQVDASVGGKTAINHPQGKNMIGAFHQPIKVFADVDLLSSLPKIEISNGLSEVIKHALISDKNYFNWLEENMESIISLKPEELGYAITRSVEIKAEIVSEDEKEKGIRKFLNFGHTFGHAIELYGKFKEFSHGQSVAMGMLMAMELSKLIEGFSEEDLNKSKKLIGKANPDLNLKIAFDEKKLLKNMSVDKKRMGNKLIFVLLEEIGRAKVKADIDESKIVKAIQSLV
jgi:3-dehydroquinate synthase